MSPLKKCRQCKLNSKHTFISLFSTVDEMWLGVLSSCHIDFPTMMDCNLNLWAKMSPFFLSMHSTTGCKASHLGTGTPHRRASAQWCMVECRSQTIRCYNKIPFCSGNPWVMELPFSGVSVSPYREETHTWCHRSLLVLIMQLLAWKLPEAGPDF